MRKSGLLLLTFLLSLSSTACGDSRGSNLELSKTEPVRKEASSEKRQAVEKPDEEEATGSQEASGEIVLTGIEKDGKKYNIVLNDVLAIKAVAIRDGKNGDWLAFPQRKQGDDWWNYVKISRGDEAALLDAVKSEKTSSGDKAFTVTDVKITPINGTGKSKAFVEFELNGGVVKLYSWKLIDGKDGLWLAPPSERDGDDYVDLVHTVDKEFQEELKKAALAAYEKG